MWRFQKIGPLKKEGEKVRKSRRIEKYEQINTCPRTHTMTPPSCIFNRLYIFMALTLPCIIIRMVRMEGAVLVVGEVLALLELTASLWIMLLLLLLLLTLVSSLPATVVAMVMWRGGCRGGAMDPY